MIDTDPTATDDGAPRVRDRRATEERILAAVGHVLARDGFSGVGVNAIAREAGIDKVLIYRYFGGLPELLRIWGASGRFWPRVSDLLLADPDLPSRPAAERYVRFFDHFIDELRRRPLTLEVLAAEVQQRNELTEILEAEREAWGDEATRVLGGAEFVQRPHLAVVTVLLVAGVQHEPRPGDGVEIALARQSRGHTTVRDRDLADGPDAVAHLARVQALRKNDAETLERRRSRRGDSRR